MTSAILTDLLESLGLLGVFLLAGVFLRAKVKIFQKAFIPASVIGGFLLLLLGPQCFNVLPVPTAWFNTYSLLPGILIVPVVASVPLGLRIGTGKGASAGEDASVLKNIVPLMFIGLGASMLQFAIGYGTHVAFSGQNLYDVFGIELAIGFVGGHGTAGTLGNMLNEMNLPNFSGRCNHHGNLWSCRRHSDRHCNDQLGCPSWSDRYVEKTGRYSGTTSCWF
jgi:ESS family glutamate:Na+ symporter